MCDPDPPPNGVTFRQQANISNQAAFVNALPQIRWLLTTNLTLNELEQTYAHQGCKPAQWAALLRRIKVVDAGNVPIPPGHQGPRDAARLAATLTGLVPGAAMPFPRQASPIRGFGGFGAARARSRSPRRRRRNSL